MFCEVIGFCLVFLVGSKAGSTGGSVYGDRFLGSMEPVPRESIGELIALMRHLLSC